MKEFDLSTHVFFGENSLERLEWCENKRIIIITDAFMEKSGVVDKLKARMDGRGNEVFVFSKTVPDPPIEVIAEGVKCLAECQANVMVALGGGSAIDAAKAVRVMADRMGFGHIEECFAIPTTSGTGSEVTKFSVITDSEKGVKYPLVDDDLQPMVAILDPELVSTVPPAITADTGIDALVHALEAYVSTEATDFTDALAEKATTLLMKFLPLAYKDGNDLLAREKVHNAACLAGMAFNAAGLGICHSIAHQIGAKFHISHGRSNAMVLTEVIRFNADLEAVGKGHQNVSARKYQRMAKLIGLPYVNNLVAVNALTRRIEEMKRMFGIPATLKDLDIDPVDVSELRSEMVENALKDKCTQTNPRPVDEADIAKIINKIAPLA